MPKLTILLYNFGFCIVFCIEMCKIKSKIVALFQEALKEAKENQEINI